jgi:hypothetical protein
MYGDHDPQALIIRQIWEYRDDIRADMGIGM